MNVEYFGIRRTVHMDDAVDPATIAPSPLGYSVGRWEGDTLVVETTRIDYLLLQHGRSAAEQGRAGGGTIRAQRRPGGDELSHDGLRRRDIHRAGDLPSSVRCAGRAVHTARLHSILMVAPDRRRSADMSGRDSIRNTKGES